MTNWNPEAYLKFRDERTQPSIDLVARIAVRDPRAIIDLGCGPGNSTEVLRNAWPGAEVAGLDNSAEMIAKARASFPQGEWILADAGSFMPERPFDIVFSNATLQWIPDHETLIPRLFGFVGSAGALAVQVPANYDSPLHQAVLSVAKSDRWRRYTDDCDRVLNYQSAPYYYDLLCGLAARLDLWETTYYHRLDSHPALIEWYRSTGLRPFLEALPDLAQRTEFEQEVLERCRSHYEVQTDGGILYPFKRIFFVAYKS